MSELSEARIRRLLHDVFDAESPSPEAVSRFREALRTDGRGVGRRGAWRAQRLRLQPPLLAALSVALIAAIVGLTLRIHPGASNGGGLPAVTAPAPPPRPSAVPPDARLSRPQAVAVAADGTIYVANTNQGTIVTVTGDGRYLAAYRLTVPAGAKPPNSPIALGIDGAGHLYIAQLGVGGGRAIVGAGTMTIDPATLVPVTASGFAFDPAGTVYISASAVCWNASCPGASTFALLVKVPAGGSVTPVSGVNPGRAGPPGDHGPASAARLVAPRGLALDAAGDLYVADSDDNRVRRIAPDGTITTVAGTGVAGFSGDEGVASSAQLSSPDDVAVDASGNLFIADAGNNRVREVRSDGTITTAAGTGVPGYSGDGGTATRAQLSAPNGIAFDAAGDLYVADTGNDHLRKVSAAGVISTVL